MKSTSTRLPMCTYMQRTHYTKGAINPPVLKRTGLDPTVLYCLHLTWCRVRRWGQKGKKATSFDAGTGTFCHYTNCLIQARLQKSRNGNRICSYSESVLKINKHQRRVFLCLVRHPPKSSYCKQINQG